MLRWLNATQSKMRCLDGWTLLYLRWGIWVTECRSVYDEVLRPSSLLPTCWFDKTSGVFEFVNMDKHYFPKYHRILESVGVVPQASPMLMPPSILRKEKCLEFKRFNSLEGFVYLYIYLLRLCQFSAWNRGSMVHYINSHSCNRPSIKISII